MAAGRYVPPVVVDWDGTAVPNVWPEQPQEFMPGFVEAMQRFHEAGLKITIASARISPYEYITHNVRDPAIVQGEIQYIRDMLDRHGLTYIDIWTKHGKPSGVVYVDDKGMYYPGRPGSWSKLTEKILARAGLPFGEEE